MRKRLAAAFTLGLAVCPASAADTYVVDKAMSVAKFEVPYLYTTVTGRLRDISGMINLDPVNPTSSSVTFSMMTNSVDTGSAELDRQLRAPDVLNAARYPQITFVSTSIRATADPNRFQVAGELTLRGVTRRVLLSVEVARAVRDRGELLRAAFLVQATLNRKDYGLQWSRVFDHGSLIVGDNLKVTVYLVASKKPVIASD
jgi:polyisoprenoid-binding protein YceI